MNNVKSDGLTKPNANLQKKITISPLFARAVFLYLKGVPMFTELLNKKIYITDTLYLRYDIKAFIEAEEKGISPFELTFPLPLDYIRAGLRCCFDELGFSSAQRSEIVSDLTTQLSQEYLQDRVLAATTAALPAPIVGSKPTEEKPDFKKLRSLFIDIMGRTEEEFTYSTLYEITDRWNDYATFMGYKAPTERFVQYDD